jgi:transcriptional regulator with XRE-family HTH domain
MTGHTVVKVRLREVVAEEVRALLGRKRMTGGALATAIGRSEMYVSRRLRGEIAFDMDDLSAIAEVLGVEPRDLMGGPKTVPTSQYPQVTAHRAERATRVRPPSRADATSRPPSVATAPHRPALLRASPTG